MFEQISKVIDSHLFETLEEMKTNVAQELDIPEDQVTFKQYPDRTDICVTKDGKEVGVIIDSRKLVI